MSMTRSYGINIHPDNSETLTTRNHTDSFTVTINTHDRNTGDLIAKRIASALTNLGDGVAIDVTRTTTATAHLSNDAF